jgi:hypothetical protein
MSYEINDMSKWVSKVHSELNQSSDLYGTLGKVERYIVTYFVSNMSIERIESINVNHSYHHNIALFFIFSTNRLLSTYGKKAPGRRIRIGRYANNSGYCNILM